MTARPARLIVRPQMAHRHSRQPAGLPRRSACRQAWSARGPCARESRGGWRTRRSSISRVLLSSACTFCAASAAPGPPAGRRLASAPISLLKPKVPAAQLGAHSAVCALSLSLFPLFLPLYVSEPTVTGGTGTSRRPLGSRKQINALLGVRTCRRVAWPERRSPARDGRRAHQ